MNKIKRWLHKDRYGIVRSTTMMCVLVVLFLFVYINSQLRQNYMSEKERASYATRMVSEAMDLTVHDAYASLENAAEKLRFDQVNEFSILNALSIYDKLSEAAILRGDSYILSDGSHMPLAENAENGLALSLDIGNNESLVGWMDPKALDELFQMVNSGEYGYAIYDVETGAYLLNRTAFTSGGYYDALLNMNIDGSAKELLDKPIAQARISPQNGGENTYYIAHRQLSAAPWGVALILPEALLQQGNDFGRSGITAACIFALLMICFASLNAIIALRKVRNSNRNIVRTLNVNERMIKTAAVEAGITVFLYNRSWERIVSCFDGLNLFASGDAAQTNCDLKTIADNCGIDEHDYEHILEKISVLTAGETDALKVHCSTHSAEERLLRFAFHASPEDAKSIYCVVSDATHKQAFEEREDIENDYLASVLHKVISVREIDISHNRWRLLHNQQKDDPISSKPGWRDYSDDLNNIVREIVHPADYSEYTKNLNLEELASSFRMGKTESSFDFRVRGAQINQYEWHRMKVRIWLNVRTNNLTANLYIFNVNAKKNAELERGERKRILNQALTALGGMYYGLYYVDLENDLSYTARSMGRELVDQLCLPYKSTFDEYINTAVHPDDREALKRMLSSYFLRKNMTEGSHFQQLEYRHRVGDEAYSTSSIIVQPARFENGLVKEVVLAVRKRNQ